MYKRFERLLTEKGLSRYKVSKDTGISQTTLSDWSTGKSTPKLDKLQRLADYLGVSIEYLLYGENRDGHYVDEEVAQIAQELFERPELKVLFDAAEDVSKETILQFAELMKKVGGDDDEEGS